MAKHSLFVGAVSLTLLGACSGNVARSDAAGGSGGSGGGGLGDSFQAGGSSSSAIKGSGGAPSKGIGEVQSKGSGGAPSKGSGGAPSKATGEGGNSGLKGLAGGESLGGAGAGSGNAGSGGGSAGSGSAGAGGSGTTSLHITSARAFPGSQIAMVGLRVAIDSQDTAVVVGPSATSNTGDPGPAVTWVPVNGTIRQKVFANEPTPNAIAVDPSDAVWLTGQLEHAATFGGTTVQATSSGYYLVKLGPDGKNIFTKAIVRAETNTVWDGGYSIAFDSAGNAYVVGILVLGDPDFHCTVLVNKFSPSGTLLADRVFHSTSPMQAMARDVAFAPNGDLVIAGVFDETLQVGTTKLTSASGQYSNGFVAILDPADLAPKRAFSFGGANYYDTATSVDVTSTGALRVSGILAGASSIGGKGVQAQTGGSAFIAELTPTGTANWVHLIQGSVSGIVWQTSTRADDQTFAVGRVDGAQTAFFSVIDGAGTLTSPVSFTGAGQNGALATAADRHGGVWVAMEGSGSTSFGSATVFGASSEPLVNWLVHIEP